MYVIFVTLFNIFDSHREKYAKPDFVKFISLEINDFVGTSCFLFLRNIDALLFQVTKVSSPPFYLLYFFINFSIPSLSLTVTARFLGLPEIKPSTSFELSTISHILHILYHIKPIFYTIVLKFSLEAIFTYRFFFLANNFANNIKLWHGVIIYFYCGDDDGGRVGGGVWFRSFLLKNEQLNTEKLR